ncbi:MAG TPA: hypothetical protein VN748_05090 [Pseudonocardiaceae bacterium]|nr:hypothetical protein [Pseudonocardiaceae bacterium]
MLLTTRIFKERRHAVPTTVVSSLAAADASVARSASAPTAA